jgi:uncharacterized protein (DUF486 family)
MPAWARHPAALPTPIAPFRPSCVEFRSARRSCGATLNPELPPMNAVLSTILLLVASNLFMTFAWYGHLRNLGGKPLIIAVLASWGIAFFEYLLQVPANRIGFGQLALPQLKMIQEVITLTVFVPFSIYYMHQPVRLDFLWAGLCLCGAVFFMFRGLPITG